MSQPTGRWCGLPIPRRYRVYICLSPIACLADTLSIIYAVILTRWMLDVPVVQAIRFVDLVRSLPLEGEVHDHIERPNPRSGLRWVFFIVGTGPALLKLISFSGIKWSKAWGLMFGLSYLVAESVSMISARCPHGRPSSVPEALGYRVDRWRSPVNTKIRDEAYDLALRLHLSGGSIEKITLLLQILPIGWTTAELCKHMADSCPRAVEVFPYVLFAMILATYGVALVRSIFTIISQHQLPHREALGRYPVGGEIYCASMVVCGCLSLFKGQSDTNGHSKAHYVGPANIVATFIWLTMEKLVELLCTKAPQLGAALLVITSPGALASADSTSHESTNRIDSLGVFFFISFCIQLCLGILWYAIVYDPTGTVNPSWTNAFG